MLRQLRLTLAALLIFSASLRALPAEKPSVSEVDRSTLTGKVACGYQGWFAAEEDGSGRGWTHYEKGGRFHPGCCSIDLWPDVSELDDDEKFATPFRHRDGSAAYVFSSFRRKTVVRHFSWMKQYGIDTAVVQRFAVQVGGNPRNLRFVNTVLAHCREGANRHGRAFMVMYDLSGMRRGQMQTVVNDWKRLVDRMQLTKDRAYQRHRGRPVVAVWGIGFNDGRDYTLDECARLIEFLKDDPRYGDNTVLLGIPTGWRTFTRDSVRDKRLHAVLRKADILSPWTIGRFGTLDGAARHAKESWAPDMAWCRENNLEYMPVVFPGFSWHNLMRDTRRRAPLDQIPRLGGRFLWKQYVEAKAAGATMIYQAMFDEIDEGTAIFKCTNDPPVGDSPFLTYEGLPPDHYLRLVGQGGRLLRGEIEPSQEIPGR